MRDLVSVYCGKKYFLTSFSQFTQTASAFILTTIFIFEPLLISAKTVTEEPKVLTDNQRIKQILARLTFGARPGDFERVKQMGVKAFIEQQLNPENIDDTAIEKKLEKLPTLNLPVTALAEQYNPPKPPPTPTPSPSPSPMPKPDQEMRTPNPTPSPQPQPKTTTKPAPTASPTPVPKNPQMVVNELQRAKLLRAVYSERQLNEVMVDFWENHFNIFIQKDSLRWMMTGFDRDSIRPFSMGRFRDLLGATAHSPAMLYYLDNWQSSVLKTYPATKDKPERKVGGINENYARELMELHTLGVDGGYTQKDVQEVARCFTGWTIRKPNEEGLFFFNPQAHDNGEKIVLGQKIPANGGIADGERVLDILAKHPSTARFIATKLARRFLGDTPPKTVIDQAAQTFLKTDGSIRETLRTIITSPQFFAPNLYQSKVKLPFEYVAASLRILNAETDANTPILSWISKMGQPLFGHLTPDGYSEQSSEWLSSGNLLVRFNFANALVTNKIKGTKINLNGILDEADLNKPSVIQDRLTRFILANEVTPQTKKELVKITEQAEQKLGQTNDLNQNSNSNPDKASQPKPPDNKNISQEYVAELLTLVLGAPEFQRK